MDHDSIKVKPEEGIEIERLIHEAAGITQSIYYGATIIGDLPKDGLNEYQERAINDLPGAARELCQVLDKLRTNRHMRKFHEAFLEAEMQSSDDPEVAED